MLFAENLTLTIYVSVLLYIYETFYGAFTSFLWNFTVEEITIILCNTLFLYIFFIATNVIQQFDIEAK